MNVEQGFFLYYFSHAQEDRILCMLMLEVFLFFVFFFISLDAAHNKVKLLSAIRNQYAPIGTP